MRHRQPTAVASVAMRHSLARATAHRIARAAPRSRSYQAWRPASDDPAADASRKVVAIVYGSFDKDLSLRDAEELHRTAPPNIEVREPVAGDAFDFDSLATATHLVVAASSQNGFPPHNFVDFAHQLLLTAETGDDDCLGHLSHAVWGNGDDRWYKTFMNVPRYVDLLLEECGSRRFYARGEYDEPHAPTGADSCEAPVWAAGMWDALQADASADAPPVAWNALWEYQPSPRHQDVTEYGLDVLVRRYGELSGMPTTFARPDDVYHQMIEGVRREREERERARLERLEKARRDREARS